MSENSLQAGKVNALWQSESESESELESPSPSQSFAYMCLRLLLHLCLSSLRSCAFSAVFLFPISFSIYSVLISVLILRRKLLQRPEIVYQNDKMELSSGAGAGANVFGNISPWLVVAANRFGRWLPHLIGVKTHTHTGSQVSPLLGSTFAALFMYLRHNYNFFFCSCK